MILPFSNKWLYYKALKESLGASKYSKDITRIKLDGPLKMRLLIKSKISVNHSMKIRDHQVVSIKLKRVFMEKESQTYSLICPSCVDVNDDRIFIDLKK